MHLVTKVILILSLIALCVFVLYITGRQVGTADVNDAFRPRAKPRDANAKEYNDPLSPLEKWRARLTELTEKQKQEGADAKAAGAPDRKAAVFHTSAADEGVAAALPKNEVVGADPPGPFLKPAGLKGEVVTPAPAQEQPQDTGRVHVVVDGDTLYGIAVQYYGDARFVSLIQNANPGLDALALHVGQKVRVPETNRAAEKVEPAKPAPKATRVYVVRQGDTLIGMALRFYGDAAMHRRIYEANSDILTSPSATLYVGQRLRLPDAP
jgi:nucleoid-associated protein YgaU